MEAREALEALRVNFATHITDPLIGLAGATVDPADDLVIGDSGTDCDTFNMVAGARLGPAPTARIETAITTFGGRPFSWWRTSGDTPSDLGRHLAEAGLVEAETETAMAATLGTPSSGTPELRIEIVTSPERLAEFADVNQRNWEPADLRVGEFYRRVAWRVLRPGSPFFYLVGRDRSGTPVAAGEGCLTGTTLGLYGISTRREWRQRGFGTAILRALLAEGKCRGATRAVLQASEEGLPLYRRLGFAEIGHITEFKPS